MEKAYNFSETEEKWQKIWRESKLFEAGDQPDRQSFSMILPPTDLSGSLDVGDCLTATIPDIIMRRKRMQGFDILWVPTVNNTGIAAQKVSELNSTMPFSGVARDFREKSKRQTIRRFHTLGIALDRSWMRLLLSPEMQEVVTGTFIRLFKEGKLLRKEHWHLTTSRIIKPAIAAIEKDEIKFIPEKWKEICLNGISGIPDWCISSSSRWGYRMPVYYCGACDKLIVEESRPGNCSRCDSTEIKDDPEVLAPWFTSILLSLLILGRDKKSADFTVFYPADIMAAGLDIVFSWVVRMIAIGIHLGKDIPVREVLINGAVRDGKGQKVKEENPNSINPLGIIGDYGADALRFTLAAQAVPGMDTSFSINRIKGYKSFINKIWHASRFTLLNLKGDETFDFDASKITTADKWMLHNLNKTIEKINVLLDQYRVNKAADLLYRFFRHEYCDWYLEFSRKDTGKEDTGKVLKFVLFKLLQLLHPFTPFITEEIYQRIKSRENFLLQTEFPSFNSDLMFYDEFAGIELLKKVIKQTRKIRMENKIDPNRRIPIYLKTGSEKERVILAKQLKYFNFLTGSAGTEIVPGFEGLPKGFKGVCPNWEILLPCECDEDRLSEMNRLKKELKEMEDRVGDFETKLTEEELKSGTSKREMAKIKKGLQASISKKEKIKKAVDDLS